MTRRPSAASVRLALLLAAPLAASPAWGAEAGGYFRYGEVKLELAHAYAFRTEKNATPGEFQTFLYLTSHPIDARVAADAFDLDNAVDSGIPPDDEPGGFVRVCIDADGSECGLWFSHDNPMESFNTSGYGKFELTSRGPSRYAGSWRIEEPEDFFDKTYQFDMRFDAEVTPPTPGQALGADGGEPGRAYVEYITALAKADFARLRTMLGDEGRWMFPEDDENAAREALKWRRDGVPVAVEFLKAERRGDEAVLVVEGVDRDEIRRRGRVLMALEDGAWRYKSADLDSVD